MSDYCHRQIGTVLLMIMTPAVVIALAARPRGTESGAWIAVVGVILAITAITILVFGWLTVQVANDSLQVRFGVGLIRRRFSIAELRAARAVRNPWYYGWGIRYTRHGWLFNVSGLDAVEIELASGRRYRIGTDQPEELVRAIERARAELPSAPADGFARPGARR